VVEYLGFSAETFFLKLRFWEVLSYSFLHGSLFHVLFNCMGLYMLGSELELRWGTRKFVTYYALCAIGGALAQSLVWGLGLLFHWQSAELLGAASIIGSSGAVYGLFMAFGRLFGEVEILFMFLFPLKAKYFVMILTGIEIISAIFLNHSGVAHLVHLGGLATGLALLFFRGKLLDGRGGYSFRRRKVLDRDEVRRRLNLIVNRKKDDDDDDNPGGGGRKYPITWN